MSEKCETPGCVADAVIKHRCKNCYAYYRYWNDRTVGDVMSRLLQVQVWESRLNNMLPTNIQTLKKPKELTIEQKKFLASQKKVKTS